MTDLLTLRPYQTTSIARTFEWISSGRTRPATVLPTGAGKTVIFSWLANKWIEVHPRFQYPNTCKVLILVHRDELASQTVKKLAAVAPDLRVGVVKAQLDEHIERDVIVGSVQTLRQFSRRARIEGVGLVIVDEAHHASAPSYRAILDHFGCFERRTPAVGFSATLARADNGDLGAVWDGISFGPEDLDILDMIPDYLVDPKGKMVTVGDLSLQEVRQQAGDLAASSLSEALLTSDAVNAVVRAYLEHASDRPTICFVPSVRATEVFSAAFTAAGVRSAPVWGAMEPEERRLVLKRFGTGDLDVIVNCMVLTEGYDEPRASCAIIARPTRSAALYVQMVGRVLRPYPGKRDALILDVVGATQDHRLATLADLTSRELQVRDGESLATAAARERERGNPSLANYVFTAKDVDLFHRSPSMWLQTKEGVWFLNTRCADTAKGRRCEKLGYMRCGTHLWFLWPDGEGQYKVGLRPTFTNGGKFLRAESEGISLETAMSWAEQYATQEDPSLANRRASWRRRNEKPSEAQRGYAETLGIEFTEITTKRELSDLMSIQIASRCLDPAFLGLKQLPARFNS